MSEDLTTAVERHCELFNECVRGGDWTPFVATFTDDAEMTLKNPSIGPIVGRPAIAAVYERNPPTVAMVIDEIEPTGGHTVHVRFHWEGGGPGTMTVRWRDDRVSAVEIALG